ncbi:MAG TPA: NmrA family NAD(P)-binding protein [Polyangiales bacterium]|nr:NmrA family NAD(P)-binding protein [Polyangiales bacterium]
MANEKNAVLLIGASGTSGREVLRATVRAGGLVRALVRSAASAEALAGEAEIVHGDLRDDRSLERALRGVRSAFYVSPHEPDEEALAERFIRACEDARVRLVFGGVHVLGKTRITRALKRAVYGAVFPRYRAKFRIGERMRRSRANPVVLVPTNFFQNDELFRSDILAGSFPQAFLKPVNRVDVRDLGEAAARALLDDSLPSGEYSVVGPKAWTGAECAAEWASALGRPVRFASEPAEVDAAIERALSGKKRDDFLSSYKVLRNLEVATQPAALAQTIALLGGRQPRTYAQYVRDEVARLAT